MNNILWGLNYWAWLGLIFLFFSGVCSIFASKATTNSIVSTAVNNPLFDLNDHLINQHKLLVDNFLTKVTMYNNLLAVKTGDLEMLNITDSTKKNLDSKINVLKNEIVDEGNKINSSIKMTKKLIHRVGVKDLSSLGDIYLNLLDELNQKKIKTFNKEVSYTKINNLISGCRTYQGLLIDAVLEMKVNQRK